ncbi:PQQ-binding-like beta-propeller repeat protein [Thermoflexus sp.]|uniref:PQQ-binding-like beta-propeller repeat protein n=1 Tax=Thermoflexus sp. TaxID=1969742 RepID=UPI00260EA7A8|nr:PQQ-binding-like beta-propeller repeat protein [Thermoflexus sp.]MCX7689803.1 PQQ-binding-like beta-propeller repeat protein [Thermoflexus sp.]
MHPRFQVVLVTVLLTLCGVPPTTPSPARLNVESGSPPPPPSAATRNPPSLSYLESPVLQTNLSGIALTATSRLFLPAVFRNFYPTSPDEWTQHAHDAQRTSYTNQVVPPPWRWKWAWNGPDAQGRVSPGKFRLPRNSQPVTGGGRVYIAAGDRGVFALNNTNGAVLWNRNPGGARIHSTPAYDPDTGSLFVLSTNGTLYRLNAATGETTGQFATGAASDLPLPPALFGDRVFFSMGNRVYAVHKASMSLLWSYDAGAPVHTPPAYSPSYDLVVAASQDLYVHAIRNANGSRAWRVKPTVRQSGDPGSASNNAEVKNGWPVIAEGHGLVLIKLRLDWDALWNPWNPWPGDNITMRNGLAARPAYQALFALRLADGSQAFITNVGHGGFGDGGYLPMGPQPVVKRFPNGQEVAYVVMRGFPCLQSPCDGRGDSRLGEMLLDDTTVPGYRAGDVRFMQNTFFPTDEQVNLSMAGDFIFGGHWMFGIAHEIVDRSPSRGTGSNPISTRNLPHIITSASNCGFSPSHYCPDRLVQDGDPRTIPGGFYIYYNQGRVYDQYWTEYATWVVSNGTIYFVSADGALVALEHGDPLSAAENSALSPETLSAHGISPISTTASLRPDPLIPYTEARAYAGQIATVEGVIRFVFNNGQAVYLGFQNPHQGAFKVRILSSDWKAFPRPPEQLYPAGTRIRVHGKIEWYQGDPQIIARAPTQIQILKPLWWADLALGLRNPAGWLGGDKEER